MSFHWSLSDCKYSWVFGTLLNILHDLNSAMVLTLPLTSNPSSLLSKPLGIVPSGTTTFSVNIIFIFYSFFLTLRQDPGIYLTFSIISLLLRSSLEQNPLIGTFFCWLKLCLVFLSGIELSVFISKSQKIFCFLFLGWILVCAYTICLNVWILISCTIPIRSPFSPSRALFCIPFVPVWCNHLSL